MTDQMIKLNIDGESLEVPAGTTVMKAAEKLGIKIPRLCYHPDLSLEGACRVCLVQVEGFNHFITSCSQQVWEGMKVQTNSPQIRQARRDSVRVLNHAISDHLPIAMDVTLPVHTALTGRSTATDERAVSGF